ncbi:MAG: pyruvate, phosphate dikinase, partial [Phycisphaerae bacterium]|nr:pyruvate, phosphate dikinase [Phycisphaerae bacterium]
MHPAVLTTGLAGLDRVLHGVAAGDNIVWQVQEIEDYVGLVRPYAEAARAAGARLIYFRFADHPPLLPDGFGAEVHTPRPGDGFEAFVDQVHAVIEEAGRGAMYLFDCLSALAEAWQADQLLGNFFRLTCPRLFDLETVTYFAVYRNRHTVYAMRAIAETTQWMLDVFRRTGQLYIRPLKVQHRSKEAMNLIHAWEGEEFLPAVDSATVSEILADSEWPGLQADTRAGYWRRDYVYARRLLAAKEAGTGDASAEQTLFRRLAGMLLAEDPHILDLAGRYLTLGDLVAVRDRQIGIGRIGGKAAGMLLARAILRQDAPDLAARLEAHDSFYVGAEVFHTFLVENGLWWARRGQRDPATFLKDIHGIRHRILTGQFPDFILDQFAGMIDYFGEWPFIVRSSSLLEDAYGHSFAGKYESVFCVNRGPREARTGALLDAVRRVYASAMGEEALQYRLRRGLLDRDEQMALLVMRVSGAGHG